MSLKILAFILAFPLIAHADLFPSKNVDFSEYDEPLSVQVVNRIKAKIAPRLGNKPLTYDRYFIVPFAYQNFGNDPEFSHSFISVIRVFAGNKEKKYTPGLREGTY